MYPLELGSLSCLDSHFEILCADNYGADLGRHPTADYAAGIDDAAKQAIFAQ